MHSATAEMVKCCTTPTPFVCVNFMKRKPINKRLLHKHACTQTPHTPYKPQHTSPMLYPSLSAVSIAKPMLGFGSAERDGDFFSAQVTNATALADLSICAHERVYRARARCARDVKRSMFRIQSISCSITPRTTTSTASDPTTSALSLSFCHIKYKRKCSLSALAATYTICYRTLNKLCAVKPPRNKPGNVCVCDQS